MSFWDTVIQDTPGMLLPPPENAPIDNLLGTADGLDPSVNNAGAQAVHPSLSTDPNSPDSLVKTAGQPAGFDLPPDQLSPDVFASWHTAYQEEYLNLPQNKAIENANNGLLIIGTGAAPIHVMLSAAQDKVFILETLQKADFATMALVDQQTIAKTTFFQDQVTGLAQRLGLLVDNPVTGQTALDQATALVQNAINSITDDQQPPLPDPPDPNNPVPADPKLTVSAADKAIFTKELTNIQDQINKMGVYSPTDINAAVQAIKDRYHRVSVFQKAMSGVGTPTQAPAAVDPHPTVPPTTPDPNQFINVISLDDGAAIKNGLQAFMNAEKQILAADNAAIQISNTGTLEGLTKHLDAPNLVAAFQLDANLKDLAVNAADTEEINQINELLKTYNAMQELINQTIATFDVSNNNDKRGLLGYDDHNDLDNNQGPQKLVTPQPTQIDPNPQPELVPAVLHDSTDVLTTPITIDSGKPTQTTPPALTQQQLLVISMFEKDLNGIASPIEDLLGITRPADFDFYDNTGKTLNYFQKSTWDEWSATLGNTVQQISQENQLKFNDINTLEKERTTHFQSATNALTKALDITSTIGRNIS